jgi:hypothetical protein
VRLRHAALADDVAVGGLRLERSFPHRWGRRDRVEHSGTVGVTLERLHKLAASDNAN